MVRKKHQSLLKQVLIYSQLYKIVTFVFFVSIEEHLKTHSKIYIYKTYIGEMKIPHSLLQKIKQ